MGTTRAMKMKLLIFASTLMYAIGTEPGAQSAINEEASMDAPLGILYDQSNANVGAASDDSSKDDALHGAQLTNLKAASGDSSMDGTSAQLINLKAASGDSSMDGTSAQLTNLKAANDDTAALATSHAQGVFNLFNNGIKRQVSI